MVLNFTGKTCLIVGGSGEIALKTAKFAKEAGLFTVLTFRNQKSERKIHDAMDGRYAVLPFDLTDESGIGNLLKAFTEKAGAGPDYVLDAAQGDLERLTASAGDGDAERYVMKNIARKALLIKAIARDMLPRKFGRFVFVSSVAAGRLNPGQGFYAASKTAVETLYRSIAVELGGRGITSVSLRLGYVDAGRGRRYLEKAGPDVLKKIPAGRVLSVDEVARTLLFLMSDAALGINATEITMDGGMTASKL